jgi:hypothetical protein
MSAIVARPMPAPAVPPMKRDLVLTAAFWLFSYFFLALRKVLSTEDLSVALSVQRVIAISIGALAFWLVLKQIEAGKLTRLRTLIGWVVGGALGMMVVRLGITELLADGAVPLARSIRWTLTWSAYFGLWVVGVVAYLAPPSARGRAAAAPDTRVIAAAPEILVPATAAMPRTEPAAADPDELSVLIEAIAMEAADLSQTDRKALAERVRRFGRYEIVGDDAWSRSQAVRSSFAWRLAIRLSRDLDRA